MAFKPQNFYHTLLFLCCTVLLYAAVLTRFLEFEFRPDGKLRYANNSNYKNDVMIRKEAYVHKSVMEELKRIIDDSEITKEDDALWPPPDRVGRQELEIVIGDEHISFTTSKIGSLIDVNQSKDPEVW